MIAKFNVKPQHSVPEVLEAAREPAGTAEKLEHNLIHIENSFSAGFAKHALQLLTRCGVRRSLMQAPVNFTIAQLPPQTAAFTNFVGMLQGLSKHSAREVVRHGSRTTTGLGVLLSAKNTLHPQSW